MSEERRHGDLGLLQNRLFETPLMIEHGRLVTIVDLVTSIDGLLIQEREFIATNISAHDSDAELRVHRMESIHDGVFVIDIVGSLVKSTSGMIFDSGLTSYQSISADLDFALEESSVRGILLRIDSPGGEVHGAFELAEKIREFPKPIHASVDDIALSGGYALAASTRRITVTNTGAVGSVGVIMIVRDQTERDKSMGVKYHIVMAGKGKDALNPHKVITEIELKPFRDNLNRIYGIFVTSVVAGRGSKLSVDKIREFGAGLAFGPGGIDIGLSDAVGSFEESLELLQKEVSAKAIDLPAGTVLVSARATPAITGITFMSDGDVLVRAPLSDGSKEQAAQPNKNGGSEMNKEEKPEVVNTEETKIGEADDPRRYAIEVVGLCNLAGFPSAAGAFLEKKISLSEVRGELLTMKADASEPEISSARGERHVADDGESNVVVAACSRIRDQMLSQMNLGRGEVR